MNRSFRHCGRVMGLFSALGFSGEAVLADHIRGRDGGLHDLMVLAHHVGDTWSGMATVGVVEDLSWKDIVGAPADFSFSLRLNALRLLDLTQALGWYRFGGTLSV